MKKETAKEKRIREEQQDRVRSERRSFVRDVRDYWKDINAAERYLQTTGKVLEDEERNRLFNRYESLKDFKMVDSTVNNYKWSVIRAIVEQVESYRAYKQEDKIDKHLTIKLCEDDLLFDGNIWGIEHIRVIIEIAKRFGYTRIFVTDHASGMTDNIALFTEFNCKIEQTTYNTSTGHFGLILNIEQSNIDKSLIDDQDVLDDIKCKLTKLGSDINRRWCREDTENEIICKYSPVYGIIKTVETYNNIVDIVKGEINDNKDNI